MKDLMEIEIHDFDNSLFNDSSLIKVSTPKGSESVADYMLQNDTE